MAIHHLLYACVDCGRVAGIRRAEKGTELCIECGAAYSRADQANIRVRYANGTVEVRHPAAWLDHIEARPSHGAPAQERVTVRFAERQKPYYHSGMYLGHVERFGPRVGGLLRVDADAVRFEATGESHHWPLLELTAVQPSSKTLQLRLRDGTLASIEFPEGSPLLWEDRVREAVQAAYTASGRGSIMEYQPRIVCR